MYTAEDLSGMTIAEIRSLANDMGYSITAVKKAEIISEFLMCQEAV